MATIVPRRTAAAIRRATAPLSSSSGGATAGGARPMEGEGGLSPAGVAFFGSLCAGTFALGCWQTLRYFEKSELVDARGRGLAAEPAHLGRGTVSTTSDAVGAGGGRYVGDAGAAAADPSAPYRRVRASGTFRHSDEVLVGPRGPPPGAMAASGPASGRSSGGMSSAPQGFFVVTPLTRSDGEAAEGETVLVNRGWVPLSYVREGRPWDRPEGRVEIMGVLTEAEKPRFLSPQHSDPKKLLWMDRRALEAGTGTDGLSPVFLTETRPEDVAPPSTPLTFPAKPDAGAVGEFKVTPAIHVGYAVTWFGLSGAGMMMTRKLMTRGRG